MRSATLQHRVLGIVFVMLLISGVWFTYAIYNKTFVKVVKVDLLSSRTGMQLSKHADVKVRGVIVGEVRAVETTGKGATIELALDPDEVGQIPENVTARILPKTLFGQKYVALQVPASPSTRHIEAGDVIPEADVSIEVETVLADSYPLLTAVQPADLSYTLNALATALEGQGETLGDNLVRLDTYLRAMNPLLPTIIDDLRLLTEMSYLYRSVMPDLARTLDNSVVTGNTIVEKRRRLQALFDEVTAMSATTRDFLQANGDNIIRLGEVSLPTLQVLAEYAPEYPCLAQGMVNWIPRMSSAYRDYTLHINLELIQEQPTGYTVDDDPVYSADNGPHCETLPDVPYSQANPGPQPRPHVVDDGVESEHGKYRSAPAFDLTSGFAGTRAEQRVVEALAAPVLGVEPQHVPDLATLLIGPIARGTEVSLR